MPQNDDYVITSRFPGSIETALHHINLFPGLSFVAKLRRPAPLSRPTACSTHAKPTNANRAKKKIGSLGSSFHSVGPAEAKKGLLRLCPPSFGDDGREECGEGVVGRSEEREVGGRDCRAWMTH